MENRDEHIIPITEALRELQIKQEKLEVEQETLSKVTESTRVAMKNFTRILSQEQQKMEREELIPGWGYIQGTK